MTEQYEIIIFSKPNFFGLDRTGMRIRQLGERLNLPNGSTIIESRGWYNSQAELDSAMEECEREYRIANI